MYQRTLGHSWDGNTKLSSMRRLPDGDLEVFHSEWPDGSEARFQIKTQVTTADRHFDVTKRTVAPEREDILRRNLQSSQLIPNDGLAHQLGERIVGRIKDPVAQAKAIYDWVVDNTIYDAALPGCGSGNVNQQLIRGQYGGRSADINGLFVAICRAIGIPARCVYGLRVGPSRLFRSLGVNGEDATRAQHVRAEFYIPGFGWIPVRPQRCPACHRHRRPLRSRQQAAVATQDPVRGMGNELDRLQRRQRRRSARPDDADPVPAVPATRSKGSLRDGTDPASFEYTITARQRIEL